MCFTIRNRPVLKTWQGEVGGRTEKKDRVPVKIRKWRKIIIKIVIRGQKLLKTEKCDPKIQWYIVRRLESVSSFEWFSVFLKMAPSQACFVCKQNDKILLISSKVCPRQRFQSTIWKRKTRDSTWNRKVS